MTTSLSLSVECEVATIPVRWPRRRRVGVVVVSGTAGWVAGRRGGRQHVRDPGLACGRGKEPSSQIDAAHKVHADDASKRTHTRVEKGRARSDKGNSLAVYPFNPRSFTAFSLFSPRDRAHDPYIIPLTRRGKSTIRSYHLVVLPHVELVIETAHR